MSFKQYGLALATSVLLGAMAPVASAQTVMKLASATINDPQHEWQKLFVAELAKRIGDKIKPQIFPASQLGAIPAMAEGTLIGTIEAFISPTSFLVSSEPRFMIFDAPGLFQSPQHATAVIHDEAYRKHIETIALGRGLRINAVLFAAPQALLTRKPTKSLADLKGQKIRTSSGTPLQIEPMKSLGTLPIPMALSEVMAQIQNGGIDGMLGGITVFVPFKFYDAAKFMTEFDFAPVISVNIINEKWFQAQPKDVQTAILDAGRAAERQMLDWTLGLIDRQKKAWVANKGEIQQIAAPEFAGMMKSFREIGDRIIAQNPAAKAEYDKLLPVVAAKAPK